MKVVKKTDVGVSELGSKLREIDIALINSIRELEGIENLECGNEEEIELRAKLLMLSCEKLKRLASEIKVVEK